MKLVNLIGEIPKSLRNLLSLEHLDLAGNDLESKIPDGLFLLKNLTVLYLLDNKLSGVIPQRVETLNLVKIVVAMNQSNDISSLPRLNVQDLSPSNFSGSIPAKFSSSLVLPNMSFNDISGSIPSNSVFRLMGSSAYEPLKPCSASVVIFDDKGTGKLSRGYAALFSAGCLHGNVL